MINKTPYIKFSSYLNESTTRSIESLDEVRVLNNIPLIFKDDLVKELDLSKVFDTVKKSLPDKFFYNIEAIYVGDFAEMREKHVNAMYKDGVIYVSNIQDDENDMIDDIAHEVAHAVEDQYGMQIYADGEIEKEFLGKRLKLRSILATNHFDIEYYNFENMKFDSEFDEFLHQEIGYPHLVSLTGGLFYTPYSISSVREYFAEVFEAYFFKKDLPILYKLSPKVIKKIELIMEEA